jgi:hypothetical protein
MEFLLIRHGRFPGEYQRLSLGERAVVNALFLDYFERLEE